MTELKLKNVDKLNKEFLKLINEKYPEETKKLLNEMANRTLARTKLKTPVKDGDLRKSWETSKLKKVEGVYEKRVQTDSKYATWIEFGVRKNKKTGKIITTIPQWPLTKSLDELKKDMPVLVKKTIKRITRKLEK